MKSQNSLYYTAGDAQKKLGLSKAQFHRWVRQGLIPRVVPPGMKQGLYPRRDIDALALSLGAQTQAFDFSSSSPADLAEQQVIAQKSFGQYPRLSLAQYIAFQQKCHFAYYSLKVRGEAVGYISLFPLPQELLDDLLTGRKERSEITINDVLPFARLEPLQIFLDEIAVNPDLPRQERTFYAGILLYRSITLIFSLNMSNYQISGLYALSYTQDGERLLKKLGFQLMAGKSLIARQQAYSMFFDPETLQRLHTFQTHYQRHIQRIT